MKTIVKQANKKKLKEVDVFLKAKGIDLLYSEADLEADCQTHEQLRKEVC